MVTRSTKGQSSREAVVAAAKRLFARQGFQATSIQQIADAVGRSQSAVMHYFPAKLDIFAAVLEEMVAINGELREQYNSDAQANALDRLMGHFEVTYQWAVEIEHHSQIMTGLFHFATYDEGFRMLCTSILKKAQSRVLEYLHAGAREKLFALPSDPERAAEILHDGLLGFLVALVATQRPADLKARQLAKWQDLVAAVTGHRVKAYLCA
jgi:AcrR family transcriptional regulator